MYHGIDNVTVDHVGLEYRSRYQSIKHLRDCSKEGHNPNFRIVQCFYKPYQTFISIWTSSFAVSSLFAFPMLVLSASLIDFDSLDSLYAFLGCQEVGIGNRVREEKPCACCVSVVLEKSRKHNLYQKRTAVKRVMRPVIIINLITQ